MDIFCFEAMNIHIWNFIFIIYILKALTIFLSLMKLCNFLYFLRNLSHKHVKLHS